MAKFYVTYPGRISQLANAYSIIEASDYDTARQIAFDTRGPAWAFMYTEEQFLGEQNVCGIKYPSQIEAFNLHEVPLDNTYR